jgi:hypothetical protein
MFFQGFATVWTTFVGLVIEIAMDISPLRTTEFRPRISEMRFVPIAWASSRPDKFAAGVDSGLASCRLAAIRNVGLVPRPG